MASQRKLPRRLLPSTIASRGTPIPPRLDTLDALVEVLPASSLTEILPTSAYFTDNDYFEKTEPLNWYGWDKLNPVHLGQRFNDRYEVVHKLDQEPSCTSWLVRDLQEGKWRRLKIGSGSDNCVFLGTLFAKGELAARKETELLMSKRAAATVRAMEDSSAKNKNTGADEDADSTDYDIVSREDADITTLPDNGDFDFTNSRIHPETPNSVLEYNLAGFLLDWFMHRGPNGRHVCLVFPLNGHLIDANIRLSETWFVQRCASLRAEQKPPQAGPATVHDITYPEMLSILGQPQIIVVTPEMCQKVGLPRHVVVGSNCPRYLVVRPDMFEKGMDVIVYDPPFKELETWAIAAEKDKEAGMGLTPLPLKIWKGVVARAFR